jgi:hypothetical protein
MDVIVHIPDDLADPLNVAAGDLPRRALEALALEEYKGRRLSRAQLRRLLGFETRFELDDFLKAHDVHADVAIEELNRQMQDLKSLGL